jgi:hypothetical protein
MLYKYKEKTCLDEVVVPEFEMFWEVMDHMTICEPEGS